MNVAMRVILLFSLIGFARPLMGAAEEAPASLTLPEAIKLALERNPEVLLAGDQLDEVKGKIKEVRADAYPQLHLEGFGLRMRDPSILNSGSFDDFPAEFRDLLVPRSANLFEAALTVHQPIYTAGKVRNAIRLAEVGQREKEDAVEAARRQVTFRVYQAFHLLLLSQESLQVVQDTYQQREKHLEYARGRFQQGVQTEIDVLRSQVQLANVEPELIRAENRIRQARSLLNSLIMVDVDAPTQVVGKLEYRPEIFGALSEAQQKALQQRPELMIARHLKEEAEILLALAHAQNKLTVDMDGRYGQSARSPKNLVDHDFARWNITFSFKLPYYDGGRKAGQIIQANARLKTAEHNLAMLENSVRLEVKAAFDEIQASARAYETANLNVKQAEKVLDMMQANYKYGAATTLDVTDSQTALTVARNAQIGATYEYEMAKARLRLAQGSLLLVTEVKP
jgi:outer membrane protein